MKQFQEFLSIIKKNKYFVLAIAGIIILLQILSLGSKPTVSESQEQRYEESINLDQLNNNQQNNQRELQEPRDNNSLTSLLLLGIVVLAFILAKKYGYLEKLYPSVFILRTSFFKQKSTGNLIIKVLIINKTKSDVSLNNLNICFFDGKKTREFAIKNIGGYNYFPLTLMPNTGHKFMIDAQKFYNNVENLKQYKTIQMKVCSTSGKCYKSIKWPVTLTFRTIK